MGTRDYTETYDTELVSEHSVPSTPDIQAKISGTFYVRDTTDEHISPPNGHNSPIIEGNTTNTIDKVDKPWLFQPGNHASPGRPRGQTIIGKLKERLDLKGGWDRIAKGLDSILSSLDDVGDIPIDKRIALYTRWLDAVRLILPYTDGRPESHQYVHRDSVNVYAILTTAIKQAGIDASTRQALIASIEQQLGRVARQSAIDVTPAQPNATPKMKEDP